MILLVHRSSQTLSWTAGTDLWVATMITQDAAQECEERVVSTNDQRQFRTITCSSPIEPVPAFLEVSGIGEG